MDANDDLIGQKVINVFPGAGGFRMGFVRERVPPPAGSVRIGNYMCVWHDHTFTEHQAGKIRNKLLREWAWAEVPPSEIDLSFRALYKEHVGDRYGDADDPRVPPTSAQPTNAPLQRLGVGALVPSRDLR